MKFNPFRPNQMVTPGMFIGRTEELRTIERCLFQTKNDNPQHFLIEGERGIGKSSLLFLVAAIASGDVPPIYGTTPMKFVTASVDMGGVLTQTDIVRAIARHLRAAMSDKANLKDKAADLWNWVQRWEIMGVKYRSEGTSQVPDDIRDDLVDHVVKIIRDCGSDIDGVLIVIDEADAPPEAAGLGEFVKLFTERLSRKQCHKVLLGLSGLPATIPKLRASHQSSPRVFEVMRLDPLEPGERRDVVSRGLAVAKEKNGFDTTIDPDAMDFLCVLSEGYPHFVQQFAYSAFAEDSDNKIDINDVLSGAYKENGALAQLGSKYFNEMYFGRISSPEYRRVLNAMAKYSDQWVVRKTLVSESGVKETTLNNALNTLKGKNIILADDTRQGYYRLPTKSFAAWINAINVVAEKSDTDPGGLFEEAPTHG